jgi:hypothetical protein
MVFQFESGETMALTKTAKEKKLNGMKFIGRQLLCGYFSQELCTDPKE